MIPSDLIARLRLMNDSIVQPLANVQGIPAELPEFQIGQRFAARIEAALPDGSFRALVAGKSLTLSLSESAKPGDTLELVVLERAPQAIVAGRADTQELQVGQRFAAQIEAVLPDGSYRALVGGKSQILALTQPAGAGDTLDLVVLDHAQKTILAGPAPAATLSRAGQIISTLLAGRAETAQPAQLYRSASLLPQPASSAEPLAPALRQAIAESGLFYEAHQAQWIAGRLPIESLLREPQGRRELASVPAASAAAQGGPPPAAAAQAASTGLLPADLQPLVQQQLDAAATQQIVWRGEIWPGQTMQWDIREEERQRGREAPEEAAAQWRTGVRLVLPRLGELSADLSLTPTGVSIRLSAADGASAALLRDGQAGLSGALAAAGVPLLAMQVDHEPA